MLVLVFSVQAVTHTGRLHRYLPSKACSSRPWDAEDARRLSCGVAASSSAELAGSSSSGGETTTSGMPWGPVGPAPWEVWRPGAGLFWGVSGVWPVLEEGRRWLSRTETLDSRLWGRLQGEEEEDGPGLWSERREEDRPSPSRGDTRQKEKKRKRGGRRRKKERGGGIRDGAKREKHEIGERHRDGV